LRGRLTTDRWDLVKVDRGVRAFVAGLFPRRPGAELWKIKLDEAPRSLDMLGHDRRVRTLTSGSFGDRARVRARRSRRLWVLEGLEDRVLLSGSPTIYTVNSTGNGTTGTGDSGTLPYVVGQANANTNTAGSEIEFDSTVFGSPQSITLAGTLVLSETDGSEVIDGPGASVVTVSGNNAVGVFSVTSGVTASLTGLTISGGLATQGGGLSIIGGAVSITKVVVINNQAVGADGAIGESGGSGLGGGVYLQGGQPDADGRHHR
jgi:hypothetical protein